MLVLAWLACAHPPGAVEAVVDPPQLVRRADTLDWRPCPPVLPDSCRIAVLEGDPRATGQLYTVRLAVPEAFEMPPHTHPRNERLTVLDGSVSVSFALDREEERRFEADDYYVTAAGVPHVVWSDAGATVQLTGIGPWQTDPFTP